MDIMALVVSVEAIPKPSFQESGDMLRVADVATD
jgi:hypothetical protein